MGLFCLRIFIAAVVLHSALWETSVGDTACSPEQYLEIGTRGIIQCAFTESLLAITWYDVDKGDPILFYKDGVTSGQGYESGEFDIYPNGSLVIRNVSINHESDFRVTKIISGTIPTVSHLITLHTTEQLELNCFVSGSRPAVNLRWIERTAERDNTLNSRYINSTYDNVTYTSRASTKFNFQKTSFLSLIVCEASSIPLDLLKGENMILLENQLANKEYQLDDAGSLSLQSALVEHEGRYTCIYDDGIDGGALLYDVFVIVDPVPAFPVIEGCNHQQYCVLEKQIQDVLTCLYQE
ncbi:hypothetical protein BSL78_19473 [Apostichopus japonicus]|uniref:Ig-like domain-containing protein n=1 Tax=Stichopus japonicus TaxID=307972 RepID=A0A2G8K6P8_STIJA|nr:hypothetical protein BSL78_19473 [Apostichopus japonicus]